jgi:hypothetical protein
MAALDVDANHWHCHDHCRGNCIVVRKRQSAMVVTI